MPMDAEALKSVITQTGVKEENLLKRGRKNGLGNTGNGIEGWQKPSRSVQAKEVQYGEYPKYMLKNSLTD
jgi:hypothetical protein